MLVLLRACIAVSAVSWICFEEVALLPVHAATVSFMAWFVVCRMVEVLRLCAATVRPAVLTSATPVRPHVAAMLAPIGACRLR